MALQSFDCQQYKYSVQALGAVVAARRTCGIKPIWSDHLESKIIFYFYKEMDSFTFKDRDP